MRCQSSNKQDISMFNTVDGRNQVLCARKYSSMLTWGFAVCLNLRPKQFETSLLVWKYLDLILPFSLGIPSGHFCSMSEARTAQIRLSFPSKFVIKKQLNFEIRDSRPFVTENVASIFGSFPQRFLYPCTTLYCPCILSMHAAVTGLR